jgi:HD-GYP domain-containing protein (c-di-GMP phosphodiesterase class II)
MRGAFAAKDRTSGLASWTAAPALAVAARLFRSTHECYDGDGYPDGLARDAIPLISRIVAVCDAYQAMISTRAYQPARDSSEAVSELRRCSGTQFDPDVVEAFVSALGTAEDGAAHPPGLQAVGSPVPA